MCCAHLLHYSKESGHLTVEGSSSQAWWGMKELWAKWRSPSPQMVIIKRLHLDCSQKKCFFSLPRICNSYFNVYIYFGCFLNTIFFLFLLTNFTGIPSFSKVYVMALHFHKGPTWRPVFTHWKKAEENFAFTKKNTEKVTIGWTFA